MRDGVAKECLLPTNLGGRMVLTGRAKPPGKQAILEALQYRSEVIKVRKPSIRPARLGDRLRRRVCSFDLIPTDDGTV